MASASQKVSCINGETRGASLTHWPRNSYPYRVASAISPTRDTKSIRRSMVPIPMIGRESMDFAQC